MQTNDGRQLRRRLVLECELLARRITVSMICYLKFRAAALVFEFYAVVICLHNPLVLSVLFAQFHLETIHAFSGEEAEPF